MKINKKNLNWLWLTLFVVILDQASKAFASHYLASGPIQVTSFFNLLLAHNPGAAFSFLSNQDGWQRWLFTGIATVLSIIIFIWITRLPPKSHCMAASLSLILGGAIGNLWDRIQLGYVVDFIQLHYQQYAWPDFNVADSAICIGAVMLILAIFRKAD